MPSSSRQGRSSGGVGGGEEKKRALLEVNPKVRNHFPDEHDEKFDRAVWRTDAAEDPKYSRTLDGRTCVILTR